MVNTASVTKYYLPSTNRSGQGWRPARGNARRQRRRKRGILPAWRPYFDKLSTGLGSVSMSTDTSGNLISQARITLFGEEFTWDGEWHFANGLYVHGAAGRARVWVDGLQRAVL